jgi:hypothetical protein
VRDQRLHELERLLLRLALRDDRLAVAPKLERAERADRKRPRPVGEVGRRRRQAADLTSVRTYSASTPCASASAASFDTPSGVWRMNP